MHEMTLAESVLQIVEEAVRREGLRRVRAVWLEIGQLSSIEPEAMRFCFDVAARDSVAEGARLEIAVTAGAAWCIECSDRVALAELGAACPRCGGYQLRVTEGAEMRVKELEAE
ncbi:MAG TPA: hydrogenase maturation nickel metallochaperone HypA [Burkholderiales bacterium]